MSQSIEISPYGNMLVYRKGDSIDLIRKVISERKLSGLRIFDHLDKIESLNFLNEYNFLEKLDIDCLYDQDYSFLKKLLNLKSLGIGPSIKEDNIIDLSNQINLEELSIQWRKGKIVGLENCKKINSICLVEYSEDNLVPISSLKNLEELKVKTSTIKNLNGIESLSNLKSVVLGNCKKLTSIKELENLKNLSSLTFDLCSNIKDLDSVKHLSNLEELSLIDCKGINSIKFVENLDNLKTLSILGNSDILDGDLKPAQKIKEVYYKHRKHYNVKIENEEHDKLVKKNLDKIKKMFR